MRPLVPAEIERFRAFAEQEFGLAFDDTKLALLADVVEQQAKSAGCPTATEYLDRCLRDHATTSELDRLAERLTVGETYFFRNRDQFQALVEVAVPARVADRRGERKLRLLSAGCASGEEAYSMAIALREGIAGRALSKLTITGIDINPAALEKATLGRYSCWSLRETPDDLRARYFLPEARQSFRLQPTIQQMVEFERRNLHHPDPSFWRPGEFDVIFCRNVLMYFSPSAVRVLVARLTASLAPGGFLFLGTAETLRGLSQSFQLRHSHRTFYYQLRHPDLRAPAEPPASSVALPSSRDRELLVPALTSLASISVPGDSWATTVQQAAHRIEQLAREAASVPPEAGQFPAPTGALPQPDLAEATRLMQNEHYREALDLLAAQPIDIAGDPDTLLLRAILLTNQSQLEQAEAICQAILGHDDLNAAAHYLMALCREHAGDQAAATDHDQYALYLDPSFAMPRLHLGLMARRAGDGDLAHRELKEALVLLAREDAARIVLLGGGFSREGLVALCRAELRACGGEG
jgi:chemotaxis protein methyltransferase CheR